MDQLTVVMVLVVTGVGWLIHIYAADTWRMRAGYYRFFSYLNLFMFFMLILVLAANYVLLFVGWEGVGLASYLLIGFYFLKKSASDAGKKRSSSIALATSVSCWDVFAVQDVWDAGFCAALRQGRSVAGGCDGASWDVYDCMPVAFMGACGKSAQLRCTSGCRTPWKGQHLSAL